MDSTSANPEAAAQAILCGMQSDIAARKPKTITFKADTVAILTSYPGKSCTEAATMLIHLGHQYLQHVKNAKSEGESHGVETETR